MTDPGSVSIQVQDTSACEVIAESAASQERVDAANILAGAASNRKVVVTEVGLGGVDGFDEFFGGDYAWVAFSLRMPLVSPVMPCYI